MQQPAIGTMIHDAISASNASQNRSDSEVDIGGHWGFSTPNPQSNEGDGVIDGDDNVDILSTLAI